MCNLTKPTPRVCLELSNIAIFFIFQHYSPLFSFLCSCPLKAKMIHDFYRRTIHAFTIATTTRDTYCFTASPRCDSVVPSRVTTPLHRCFAFAWMLDGWFLARFSCPHHGVRETRSHSLRLLTLLQSSDDEHRWSSRNQSGCVHLFAGLLLLLLVFF
jgi:hypothetical protein